MRGGTERGERLGGVEGLRALRGGGGSDFVRAATGTVATRFAHTALRRYSESPRGSDSVRALPHVRSSTPRHRRASTRFVGRAMAPRVVGERLGGVEGHRARRGGGGSDFVRSASGTVATRFAHTALRRYSESARGSDSVRALPHVRGSTPRHRRASARFVGHADGGAPMELVAEAGPWLVRGKSVKRSLERG